MYYHPTEWLPQGGAQICRALSSLPHYFIGILEDKQKINQELERTKSNLPPFHHLHSSLPHLLLPPKYLRRDSEQKNLFFLLAALLKLEEK